VISWSVGGGEIDDGETTWSNVALAVEIAARKASSSASAGAEDSGSAVSVDSAGATSSVSLDPASSPASASGASSASAGFEVSFLLDVAADFSPAPPAAAFFFFCSAATYMGHQVSHRWSIPCLCVPSLS
jgi:hypothetical protein